jgi:hypothetical protein
MKKEKDILDMLDVLGIKIIPSKKNIYLEWHDMRIVYDKISFFSNDIDLVITDIVKMFQYEKERKENIRILKEINKKIALENNIILNNNGIIVEKVDSPIGVTSAEISDLSVKIEEIKERINIAMGRSSNILTNPYHKHRITRPSTIRDIERVNPNYGSRLTVKPKSLIDGHNTIDTSLSSLLISRGTQTDMRPLVPVTTTATTIPYTEIKTSDDYIKEIKEKIRNRLIELKYIKEKTQ